MHQRIYNDAALTTVYVIKIWVFFGLCDWKRIFLLAPFILCNKEVLLKVNQQLVSISGTVQILTGILVARVLKTEEITLFSTECEGWYMF